MMFFVLGFLLLFAGGWFVKKGLKNKSHEMIIGSSTIILAGFFICLWGAVIFLSRSF